MKYSVKTEGMGCPHCIKKVTKAMEELGAAIVRMELNDFTVEYSGDPADIKNAVEAKGFRFVSAEEE